MDGQRKPAPKSERPIAKPDFPLPGIFDPSKRSEMPTRPQTESSTVRERAHFFLKDYDKDGRPTYGFVITTEPTDHKSGN